AAPAAAPAAAPPSVAPAPAPAPAPADAAAAPPPRRERLPDIEEINSTLRPSDVRGTRHPEAPGGRDEAAAGRGFRRGFALMLLLAILLIALYVGAPRITAALPQAGDALAAYVAAVDSARLWLHGVVAGLRGAPGG
ncbi:MAG: hypothetical protein KJZ85_14105, partial [Rhodobacteraceae bacterium]|nr:hypothetical protein [Paracoccaceae bacterium]